MILTLWPVFVFLLDRHPGGRQHWSWTSLHHQRGAAQNAETWGTYNHVFWAAFRQNKLAETILFQKKRDTLWRKLWNFSHNLHHHVDTSLFIMFFVVRGVINKPFSFHTFFTMATLLTFCILSFTGPSECVHSDFGEQTGCKGFNDGKGDLWLSYTQHHYQAPMAHSGLLCSHWRRVSLTLLKFSLYFSECECNCHCHI